MIQAMDVDALKLKIIDEYNEFICKVKQGYKPNYEFILEEISFINNMDDLDNESMLQYYLNNKWRIQS